MKTRTIISYILKSIIAVASITGVVLFAIPGVDGFMGGGKSFMYFTIQSNMAIAVVAIIGIILMALKKQSHAWEAIQLVFTISISLTGCVFCFVLAPTMGAVAFGIKNILTHMIAPLCSIADFFVENKKYKLLKRDVSYVVIPPICYVIYAGIGYALNWQWSEGENYPYFFLNWGSPAGAFGFSKEAPYMGTIYYILILAGFVVGLSFLYVYLSNLANKKNINKSC